MLNERRIPNPTEYKRLKGLRYDQPKGKNSTLWKYSAIASMLVNEIYLGNMVQGKYGSVSYKTKENKPRPKSEWYIVEGTHEPVISTDLWNRVQELTRQKAKPFIVGSIGLFARKAICLHCGCTMRSTKNRGAYYLTCANRYVSKNSCVGSFASVNKLEKTVLDEINKMAALYLDKDDLAMNTQLANGLEARKAKLENELASYKKKLHEYSKGLKGLYLDKAKGIISEDEYLEYSVDFRSGKERIESLIAKTKEQFVNLDNRIHPQDDRRQIAERRMNLPALDREIVETLVDHITVGKRDAETKELPIEIFWKF
jgi:hypothetical protein